MVHLIWRGGQLTPAWVWSIEIGQMGSSWLFFPIKATKQGISVYREFAERQNRIMISRINSDICFEIMAPTDALGTSHPSKPFSKKGKSDVDIIGFLLSFLQTYHSLSELI